MYNTGNMPNGQEETEKALERPEGLQTFDQFFVRVPRADIWEWDIPTLRKIYELTQGRSGKFDFFLTPSYYAKFEMDLFHRQIDLVKQLCTDVCCQNPQKLEELFIEILHHHLVLSGLSIVKEKIVKPESYPFYLGTLTVDDQTSYKIQDEVGKIGDRYEELFDSLDLKEIMAFGKNPTDSRHSFEISPSSPISLVQAKAIVAFCEWSKGIAKERLNKHSYDLFQCSGGQIISEKLRDSQGILKSGGSHWVGSIYAGVWQFLQLAHTVESFKLKHKVNYTSSGQTWGWQGELLLGDLPL